MPKRRFPSGRSQSQVALEPEVAIAAITIFSALSDGDGINEDECGTLYEMLSGIGLALYEVMREIKQTIVFALDLDLDDFK